MLEMMGLDNNSIIIIHGGGVYGDKPNTMRKWVVNFMKTPKPIRDRIVLENDEFSYSIEDVLYLAKQVDIPVIFDLFHYYCYHITLEKISGKKQRTIAQLLPEIVSSWKNRIPKFHISEQREGSVRGSHSDYVETIPGVMLQAPKLFNKSMDIMVEAKQKNRAVEKLKQKYKNQVC